MSFITYFAIIAAVSVAAMGVLSLLAERGYSFDLRRRNRRSGKDGRAGGRREDDRLATGAR